MTPLGNKEFMTPLLGQMTISLGEEEQTLNLDEIVPISADLSDEFSRQPSLYAYVAMLSAQAEAAWAMAKRDAERERADSDQIIREEARAREEKITEGIVSSRVTLDPAVQKAEEEEAEYRYQYLLIKAVVQAMDQRAQMLISLGAHLRAEADMSGMIIRDAKSRLEAIKAIGRASHQDGKK